MAAQATGDNQAAEIEALRERLKETEDMLDAIRHGAVDALVIRQSDQQQVFTLQSADHTYRVLVESMSQGAVTVADTGTILYSNKFFSRIMNLPLEQIIGAQITDILRVADSDALQKALEFRKRTTVPRTLECTLLDDNNTTLLISVSLMPKSPDNAHISVVVTDITERKRAEKAKDEFISLASHQLRTPATGVKQYLGMLLEGYCGELEEKQKSFVATAYNSNEKQLAIIGGILKTAQIDSGMYRLTKTPQNLLALLEMVAYDFKPLLGMRQQHLEFDVSPDIVIDVDAAEFSIALTNLLENASKYSNDDTTIKIWARQTKKSTKICFTDQGVGINPGDEAKIFEKFTRVDNVLSDTVTGSGLGLYWTKRIITVHNGTISVKSTKGEGTTFIIQLPITHA